MAPSRPISDTDVRILELARSPVPWMQGAVLEFPADWFSGAPVRLRAVRTRDPSGKWTISLSPDDGKGLYSAEEAAQPSGKDDGGFC